LSALTESTDTPYAALGSLSTGPVATKYACVVAVSDSAPADSKLEAKRTNAHNEIIVRVSTVAMLLREGLSHNAYMADLVDEMVAPNPL